MEGMILVRLRDSGQTYFYNKLGLEAKEGDYVIIEHDRGVDYGQIIFPKDASAEKETKEPLKKILRIAREGDLRQIEENRLKAKEAFNTCVKKIGDHKLDMKLVQAEYLSLIHI